ncbi:MAG: type II toxin-antitoxin system mRNA interferase toxin, RelE/StbE family [Candidatus Peregrinibacteria bacterium]|nr:type II toxin-antitoxin system mRNA interferase toxin, RelE/StbE family [Candidatus Peregrinibacteria bacterium]
MIDVVYKTMFLRQYRKLPEALQWEVKEKIELFRNNPRNPSLRTHKLGGTLKGCLSFSVNYEYRIVFYVESKQRVALLAVGDHSVYE